MEQLILEPKMDLFKWKQYESAIILQTVRWYLKSRLLINQNKVTMN
jgi:transposase, IS6 family